MRTVWFLLVVSVLGFSAPALAAKRTASVSTLVRQAQQLYAKGRYAQAARKLEQAQEISPHPRLVYNIARAYDQAGELEKALDAYQQYVASTEGTDPTLLKRSALAIDRLRGLLDARAKRQRETDAEQARLKAQAEAAKERAQEQSQAAAQARAQAEAQAQADVEAHAKSASRARLFSYVAGGLAVAGLATGVGFGLSAKSAKNDFENAGTVELKQSYQSTTKSRALLADLGFGVAIAGAVSAYLLWPKHPDRMQAVVVPTAGPNGGGAAVEVSF